MCPTNFLSSRVPSRLRAFAVAFLVPALLLISADTIHADPPAQKTDHYEYREPSRDGTGKFYMGREIAQVMGHAGAWWLERDEREIEERPRLLIDNMGIESHHVIADIGAGSGYFTFRMARLVPDGKVLAVDIQPEMLEIIRERMEELDVKNVEPILGQVDDPNLPPNSVDIVLLVDAYHEFDHPREMMEKIAAALKPAGRVVLVEYRGEDPNVPIKPLHKMTERQAILEMEAVGLTHLETKTILPRQHLMFFGRASDDVKRE